MQTKLTKLLGIRHPIIQGGMAWIADASLASAVSNAGGLGIISAMNANADWVREEIRKCREATDQPFGVNIMLMSPHVEEVAQMVAEEKVPVVTTGAGNPSRFVKLWKEAGVKILPVVASTALAKMVERAGVDAVIAEGGERWAHHNGKFALFHLKAHTVQSGDLYFAHLISFIDVLKRDKRRHEEPSFLRKNRKAGMCAAQNRPIVNFQI